MPAPHRTTALLRPFERASGEAQGSALSIDKTYRVLARKYRPSSFADLIGQEAMVRTLSNAFSLDRIHQAYLLSGVRGVGKTTTARIMARALNYHRPARNGSPEIDAPSIRMDEIGTHCQAIIDSRHVDVVEMDAASHTGIDDVRELIEGARYRPVMARTKVYIIDEVHMLSKQAFNGLLKTLEEPPDHVKFLFATTEADKVPVTVRSRCQRFDLRRIETDVMIAHLGGICAREGVGTDAEALLVIARAAEGSVRDALSLLDQAIAHGATTASRDGTPRVDAETVRAMLGLADRTRIIDLFEAVMRGRLPAALDGLKHLHDAGADPGHVLSDLADFVHLVTRLKLVPDAAKDSALTEEERRRGGEFAAALSLPVLTRAWQLLLKGLGDVKDAPRPVAAADMVLVRLACVADLPTPDEALRRLASMPAGSGEAASVPMPAGAGAPRAQAVGQSFAGASPARSLPVPTALAADAAPQVRLGSFQDLVALAQSRRDIQLKTALERDIRLVRFEEGHIEFAPMPGASPLLAAQLMKRLNEWTGTRWMVSVTSEGGALSLREQAEAAEKAKRDEVAADPLVRKVLETFPGSQIVAVRSLIETAPPPPIVNEVAAEEDVGYADDIGMDDEL